MDKTIAKVNFTEYEFLELFVAVLKDTLCVPIIDRVAAEEVLLLLSQKEDYKVLFEDITIIDQIDNKRVDLHESFLKATIYNLLSKFQDSTTSRYVINLIGDDARTNVVNKYDSNIVEPMTRLVQEFYPMYLARINNPEDYKFYLLDEWENLMSKKISDKSQARKR